MLAPSTADPVRPMNKASLLSTAYWVALIGLILGIYLPGLGNQPIFDDSLLFEAQFRERYGSLFDVRERMLSYGSFLWVEALFGEALWMQRVVNLALHIGVVVALYALMRSLLRQVCAGTPTDDASTLAGLRVGIALFALNPVAVYGTAYLIQRSILMATLFVVLAALAYVHALTSGRKAWFAAAALAYVCALLSKEHAVLAALLAVPLYVFIRRPGRRRVALIAAISGAFVLLAGIALYAVYGSLVGQLFDPTSRAYAAQLEALKPGIGGQMHALSVLNQAALFFWYGALWFVPNVLAMSIDMRPAFPLSLLSFPEVLGALGYLALLGGAAWLLLRRTGMLAFVGLCALMPAVLFGTEFVLVWVQDPFVLYRSYLWAIALPGLVCAALHGLRPYPLYLGGLVVACVFAGLALERTLSLQDTYRVWSDAADKVDLRAPANAVGRARAFVNRGTYLLENGLTDQAYRDFVRAIELGEPEGAARFNAGVALQQMNRHEEALAAFAGAAAQGFRDAALYYQRGESLYALGRADEALAAFSEGLRRPRQDEALRRQALLRRAEAAIGARRFERAIEDFETLLARDATDPRLRMGYGMALVGAQDGARAQPVFEGLIAQRADVDQFHYGLAMALTLQGQREAARAAIERAIALGGQNPAYLQLREQLAR